MPHGGGSRLDLAGRAPKDVRRAGYGGARARQRHMEHVSDLRRQHAPASEFELVLAVRGSNLSGFTFATFRACMVHRLPALEQLRLHEASLVPGDACDDGVQSSVGRSTPRGDHGPTAARSPSGNGGEGTVVLHLRGPVKAISDVAIYFDRPKGVTVIVADHVFIATAREMAHTNRSASPSRPRPRPRPGLAARGFTTRDDSPPSCARPLGSQSLNNPHNKAPTGEACLSPPHQNTLHNLTTVGGGWDDDNVTHGGAVRGFLQVLSGYNDGHDPSLEYQPRAWGAGGTNGGGSEGEGSRDLVWLHRGFAYAVARLPCNSHDHITISAAAHVLRGTWQSRPQSQSPSTATRHSAPVHAGSYAKARKRGRRRDGRDDCRRRGEGKQSDSSDDERYEGGSYGSRYHSEGNEDWELSRYGRGGERREGVRGRRSFGEGKHTDSDSEQEGAGGRRTRKGSSWGEGKESESDVDADDDDAQGLPNDQHGHVECTCASVAFLLRALTESGALRRRTRIEAALERVLEPQRCPGFGIRTLDEGSGSSKGGIRLGGSSLTCLEVAKVNPLVLDRWSGLTIRLLGSSTPVVSFAALVRLQDKATTDGMPLGTLSALSTAPNAAETKPPRISPPTAARGTTSDDDAATNNVASSSHGRVIPTTTEEEGGDQTCRSEAKQPGSCRPAMLCVPSSTTAAHAKCTAHPRASSKPMFGVIRVRCRAGTARITIEDMASESLLGLKRKALVEFGLAVPTDEVGTRCQLSTDPRGNCMLVGDNSALDELGATHGVMWFMIQPEIEFKQADAHDGLTLTKTKQRTIRMGLLRPFDYEATQDGGLGSRATAHIEEFC